ncbi:IclR family transcriptional regulator [Kitasatospora indigofera]|uniref:IclR family transcriptional regulator n=1 Tax=Kitasatospora indigofera TaxID=67307 RepID=UPI0036938896
MTPAAGAPASAPAPRPIPALTRAGSILRLLAGGDGPLALADVAAPLGLPKGTTHGILRTLRAEGLVEQDASGGRYRPGPELLRLGHHYLDTHELVARARPHTDDLAHTTGQSVHLVTHHRQNALIVHHVPRPDGNHQAQEVGGTLPLHSTALGKILLAFDPATRAQLPHAPLKAFTSHTVTDADVLDAQCATARALSWAASVEETWNGVASLAAPVHDHRGRPVGAVGITGPVDLLRRDGRMRPELTRTLIKTARAISPHTQ